MLSTHDIVALTGCSDMRLQRWANAGIVEPLANGRRGRGRQRQYSLAQAVAFAYATQLAEHGWNLPGGNVILRHIAGLSDDELERRMEKGQTLVTAPGIWVNPSKYKLSKEDRQLVRDIDLSRAYRKVATYLQNKLVCSH